MASLRGYSEPKLTTEEFRAKAVAWHEKRAAGYERMSRNPLWTEEQQAEFRLAAEVERRNAADYESGRVGSVLDELRSA